MSLEISKYGRELLNVVIALITVAIAFGIGQYIVTELNAGTNNSLAASMSFFTGQANYVNMALTFLFIGIVAAVGIALVKMMARIGGASATATP